MLKIMLLAALAFSEERVLVSVNKATMEVAITAFNWGELRRQNPGLNDAQIWTIHWKSMVPAQYRSSDNKGFTRSGLKKLLPQGRDNRRNWRWSNTTKKVYEKPEEVTGRNQ